MLHRAADGHSGGVRAARLRDRGVPRRRVRVGDEGVVGHQGFLLEEEGDDQAEDEHRHQVEEDPRHGVGVGPDVAVAQGRGQGVHQLRGEGLRVGQPGPRARGQAVGQGVGEPFGEEGAEDGGSDAAADLPEVVVGAGGRTEVGGGHGVLHGEDQHGHHHADAGAEDGHPDAVVQPGRADLQAGQQPHADHGEGAAEDRVGLVAAGVADELSGDDRGADDAGHHRQHEQARLGGGGPVDHLQVGRQVAGGAEQSDADHQADEAGDVEDGVPEQPQRHEGFGGEALDDEEEDGRRGRSGAEAEDHARVPGVLRAAPAGQQEQAGGGGGQQQRAEDVQPGPDGRFREFQRDGDDGESDQAEGHVDVEAPAPGEVVREVAAEQGPGHGGEAEGGADQAHVPAALPGWHDVGDDRLHADHEAARADALQGAERDELVHGLCPARERGAGDEDDDGELEDALAAEEVAELAVDGQSDRGRQKVGGDRPGHPVQAVQLTDDLRERGGDDHLLQGGQEQGEQEREQDQPHPPRAQSGSGGRWWCGAVGRCYRRFVLRQSDTAHLPLPSSRCRTIPA